MIPNKGYLFNKIPTSLVENKNKIPTFWVESKSFSQSFVFAFEKLVFFCLYLDPGSGIQNPDWKTNPGSGSVKNESGSETLPKTRH